MFCLVGPMDLGDHWKDDSSRFFAHGMPPPTGHLFTSPLRAPIHPPGRSPVHSSGLNVEQPSAGLPFTFPLGTEGQLDMFRQGVWQGAGASGGKVCKCQAVCLLNLCLQQCFRGPAPILCIQALAWRASGSE